MIAGVVIETVRGAEPQVAARLLRVAGVSLCGGDGDHRIAAVLDVEDGAALERLAEGLVAGDEEILGVFPPYVGSEDGDR